MKRFRWFSTVVEFKVQDIASHRSMLQVDRRSLGAHPSALNAMKFVRLQVCAPMGPPFVSSGRERHTRVSLWLVLHDGVKLTPGGSVSCSLTFGSAFVGREHTVRRSTSNHMHHLLIETSNPPSFVVPEELVIRFEPSTTAAIERGVCDVFVHGPGQ